MEKTSSKICRVCSQDTPLNKMLPRYDRKGHYSNICKSCHNLSTKDYYHEKKEVRKDYNKAWREGNKDHIKSESKIYYSENKEKINAYLKSWQSANKDRMRMYGAARRALQKQALPKWLNEDQMREIDSFYAHARDCELVSGQAYHVDHIVPLKGENVCGLHVPWNLQVLPADVNLSKHNNFNGW